MTDEPKRNMPHRIDIGQSMDSSIGHPMDQFEHSPRDEGRVMGYKIPTWQRPLVWTQDQKASFVQSLWLGIPVGTYTFNRSYEFPEFDDVLIDGQQRLNALQCFIQNEFPVFGYHWAETTKVDRRFFDSNKFGCYITNYEKMEDLITHYNRLNFSGTPHLESDYVTV